MRLSTEIDRIFDSGAFFGKNRAHGRVTVEPYWQLNVTADAIGTSTRGPYRWWKRADDSQLEIEVPNLKTIDIDRTVQQDVASCSIQMLNQWHNLNSAEPAMADQLGDPGHFWFERGKNPSAGVRWDHTESLGAYDKDGTYLPDFSWKNVLVPNALLRTYQGWGGYDADNNPLPISDALEAGNLLCTGVWLVDTISASTEGYLNLNCRDIGRLLLEQFVFPPLAPLDHYPVHYYPAGTSQFASVWGPQHRFDTRGDTSPGHRTRIPLSYHQSSVDRIAVLDTEQGGWNASVTNARDGIDMHYDAELPVTISGQSGCKGSNALDASSATYAVSTGNQYSTSPSAYDFWEYLPSPVAGDFGGSTDGHVIDEVNITAWGGGYECYISVLSGFGTWYDSGLGNIPYESTVVGADTQADIPYVMKVNIPAAEIGSERMMKYNLPNSYNAMRVRITLAKPQDSGVGTYPFRSGLRYVGVFNSEPTSTRPVVPTVAGLAVDPFTYAMARHPVHGYWLCDSSGNVYGYGEATDGHVDVDFPVSGMAALPKGNGYYVLEQDGTVHAVGDAQHYGDWVLSGFALPGAPTDGEWQAPVNKATDIAVNYNGTGYWVCYGDGMIRGFGDVDMSVPYAQQGNGAWYGDVSIPGPEASAGVIQRIFLPGTPVVTWCEIQMTSPKTGRSHWRYMRATGIVGHPHQNGFWVTNAHGEYFAFGASSLFNRINQADPNGPYAQGDPSWGDGVTIPYGGLWQRTFNKGRSNGFVAGGYATSIECTEDGDGLWILFGSGQIGQFGAAIGLGPVRYYGTTDPKLSVPSVSLTQGSMYSTLPPEYQFFGALTWGLVRAPGGVATATGSAAASTPKGTGFWVLSAAGGVGSYNTQFWGSPSSTGMTGYRYHEGNYCVDDTTEVFTNRGWLSCYDLTKDDQVLGINPATSKAEWQEVSNIFIKETKVKMYETQCRGFDALTTENHKWLVQKSTVPGWRWTTSEELNTNDHIPVRAAVDATAFPSEAKLSDDLVLLAAYYWTEGHLDLSGRGRPRASLSQSREINPESWQSIHDALERLWGPPGDIRAGHHWNMHLVNSGATSFRLSVDKSEELTGLVEGSAKIIRGDFLFSLTESQIKMFVEESIKADGHVRKGNGSIIIAQSDLDRLRSFEPACILAGFGVSVTGNSMTLVRLNTKAPIASLGKGSVAKHEIVEYEGVIWCPTTTHHNWLARRNGKTYFTGNTDYTDIVKELLMWGGWWEYDAAPPMERAEPYGIFETTGVFSDTELRLDKWDKKSLMDGIKLLRQVVNYLFYIDEEGAAHFESANFWRAGNFDTQGERIWVVYDIENPDGSFSPRRVVPTVTRDAAGQTVYTFDTGDEAAVPYIPELNERTNLTSYSVTADFSSMRSQMIVGATQPNYWDHSDLSHGATTSAGGFQIYEPPAATVSLYDEVETPALRGITRPAMLVNRRFTNQEEQKTMIELLQLHSWFAQRVASAQAPANPCVGINDQIKVIERQTGDTYIHYVRGMKTQHDVTQGKYTMALETNWLGTADNWVIQSEGAAGGIYDPLEYALVSDNVFNWALRTDRGAVGEIAGLTTATGSLDLDFDPGVISKTDDWLMSGTMRVAAPGLTNVNITTIAASDWMVPGIISIGGSLFALPPVGQSLDLGDIAVASDTDYVVLVTGQNPDGYFGSAHISLRMTADGMRSSTAGDSLVITQSGDGQLSGVPVPFDGSDWGEDGTLVDDGDRTLPVLTLADLELDITELHEGGEFPYSQDEDNRFKYGPTFTTVDWPGLPYDEMIVLGDSLSALGFTSGALSGTDRWSDAVLDSGAVSSVVNGAIMGHTTSSMRALIEEEDPYPPQPQATDVFVVFFGANDVNTTVSSLGLDVVTPEVYQANLEWFLDSYPAERQIVMYPWEWSYSAVAGVPVPQSTYEQYRDAAAAAAEAKGAAFIDVGVAAPDPSSYQFDGIHCNAAGVTFLADLVESEIRHPGGYFQPGLNGADFIAEGWWGTQVGYHLAAEEGSQPVEAMVQVLSVGGGMLADFGDGMQWYLGGWLNDTLTVEGNTWGVNRAGILSPVSITGTGLDPSHVYGWSSIGSNDKQFGQMSTNADGTPSYIHAYGYGDIASTAGATPEAAEGFLWWTVARIVGTDETAVANAHYRLIPVAHTLGTGDLAGSGDGGFVGRGRVLTGEWQIITGHTCSMAQLEAHPPVGVPGFDLASVEVVEARTAINSDSPYLVDIASDLDADGGCEIVFSDDFGSASGGGFYMQAVVWEYPSPPGVGMQLEGVRINGLTSTGSWPGCYAFIGLIDGSGPVPGTAATGASLWTQYDVAALVTTSAEDTTPVDVTLTIDPLGPAPGILVGVQGTTETDPPIIYGNISFDSLTWIWTMP